MLHSQNSYRPHPGKTRLPLSLPASLLCLAASLTSASALQAAIQPLPRIITAGGIYSGDLNVTADSNPVVSIQTSAAVTIIDSHLSGPGDLISSTGCSPNVTIRNCTGFGLDPIAVGATKGRFAKLPHAIKVVIEHCYAENTEGMKFQLYDGDGSSSNSYTIRYNRFRNIDGRRVKSLNPVVYSNGSSSTTDFDRVNFVQFADVRNVAGIEIAYNEVLNAPYSSRVEDNINFYMSSGQNPSQAGTTGPIRVHDNFIWGAYTSEPYISSSSDPNYDTLVKYNGGGIISDGRNPTSATASCFIQASYNQIIATTDYGVSIAAGHDVTFDHNTVLTSSHLPDGTLSSKNTSDFPGCGGRGVTLDSDATADDMHDAVPTFYNNKILANTVGWNVPNIANPNSTYRQDLYYPDGYCSHASDPGATPPHTTDATKLTTAHCSKGGAEGLLNTSINPGLAITLDDEKSQFVNWWSKLNSAGLQVGVVNGEILYEGERLPVATTSGKSVSGIKDFNAAGNYWASYPSTAVNESVSFYVHVPRARKYRVVVGTKINSARGDFQLQIAPTLSGTYTNYGTPQNCRTSQSGSTFEERNIADIAFSSDGTQVFRFLVVNTGGSIGVDYIKLVPLDIVQEMEEASYTVTAGSNTFQTNDGNFSDYAAMLFTGVSSGDSVAYVLPGIAAGSYKVYVGVKTQTNRGKFALDAAKIDATGTLGAYGPVGPASSIFDTSAATSTYPEINVTGSATWNPGSASDKSFRFTVTPGSYAAGLNLMLDYVRLVPQ